MDKTDVRIFRPQFRHILRIGIGQMATIPLCLSDLSTSCRPSLTALLHSGIGLRIPLSHNDPHRFLGEFIEFFRVPLAGHQIGGSEHIRTGDVGREGEHTTHRLPRVVEAIPVNRILLTQLLHQLKQRLRLITIRIGQDTSKLRSHSHVVGVVLGLREAEESYQNHRKNCSSVHNCIYNNRIMCFFHCGFNAAKVKKKFNVVQMIICILCEGNNATRCIPKILIHAFIMV